MRRLWDSWEDDAEIRDVATGRFVDRDKLHRIDFEGRWFSVRGPSITPRPPQGQPVVGVLAHVPPAFELAARAADVVFTTPESADDAARLVREVRSFEDACERRGEPLRIFGDVVVFLDRSEAAGAAHKDRLDGWLGRPYRSDAHVHVGTPAGLVDLVLDWQAAGLDGVRLRPAAVPHDLDHLAGEFADLLRATGALAPPVGPTTTTLRARLGLSRPENRYVA